MARYTLIQIAAAYDSHVTTTHRHIQLLIKQKKFKKSSPGKKYSENEARILCELLDFPLGTLQKIAKFPFHSKS